jgi:Ca2+-binding EF-hand superfamily protein
MDSVEYLKLYKQYFPFGDPSPFATRFGIKILIDRSFEMIDSNKNGYIEFDEFLKNLSMSARGRMEEKLNCNYLNLIFRGFFLL